MKKGILIVSLLCAALSMAGQSLNAIVKELNQYILYYNANVQGLEAAIHTMARYQGLFQDHLRSQRLLGGEPYEKPKPSPFLDTDVFDIGQDDPAHLYALAIKNGGTLPSSLKTQLNAEAKATWDCSQRIVLLLDSLSDIFSAPPITVTARADALPYRLLYAGAQQLADSKAHRDRLFGLVQDYFVQKSRMSAPLGDYIYSVDPLRQGVAICQSMLTDLGRNDSSHIAADVQRLDSLIAYLDRAELTLLKGIRPIGNSRHFPNKGNFDGFDLYNKYEDILNELGVFSNLGRSMLQYPDAKPYPKGKWHDFQEEGTARFNGHQGLLYTYNEYVLLIGGGKMKLLSEAAGRTKYIYKGWSDGSHTLPLRTQLLWMKETPRFWMTGEGS